MGLVYMMHPQGSIGLLSTRQAWSDAMHLAQEKREVMWQQGVRACAGGGAAVSEHDIGGHRPCMGRAD